MTKLTHIKTNETEDFPDLIDLQAANITQVSKDGVKGDWKVKKNITGELLGTFSSNISDVGIRQVLNFAKKFEIIAFNEGVKLQKTRQNELLRANITELEAVNTALGAENIRLAGILEKLIPEV